MFRLISSKQTLEVCREAADSESAVLKARELLPDVILPELSMLGRGGLNAARVLKQQIPGVKIILLSQHDPARLRAGALQAGADACVNKSRPGTDLLPAIKSLGEDPDKQN